jgi:hypothetical protein
MYETSQMAYLLKHATSRSLCLIDEYGAGTSGPDGLALVAKSGERNHGPKRMCSDRGWVLTSLPCVLCLTSTLLHLARQSSPPKVLFTTHLHELASMQLVDESDQVSYWKMDFQTEARREEQAQHHQEESKTSESASESGSAGFSSDERPAQRQKISHSTSGEGSRSAQPPSRSSQSRSSSGSGAGGGGESTSCSSLHLSTPPSSSSSRLLPPLITCLHRLVPGVAHRSYGTSCAIAAGVPAVWMQRAEEVAEKMERKEEIAPIGGLTRGEVEEFSRFAAFVLHVSGYRSSSAPAASPSAPSSLSNSSTVASLLSDISSGRINLEAAFSHIAPERVSQLMEEYRKQLNGGGGSGQQSDNSSSSAIEEQRMME